ncbi:bifunctional phosphoribosylaminoimidazolecarboxamide formyltransferase/IMP cyclohydrolase [Loigolactobacillus jiayinensis]|uniref:Bifunctional purine biosynthesis protein PurH n=1 Tax=Loigolactobacillus jiayinensis TaxID=2486016 RepID=A0ABW1RG43_9LACO|nr:bifunctional phosphoribosylaminoimidazolecarboxamide formyltransferase/IMP cyclohydrolase [Loigolactobacillus jiayinensis]
MKTALLSVSDKTGLVAFAQGLIAQGYRILSTGGTQKVLAAADVAVTPVEAVTHFPEMLDGRVKTLHPAIHAALLAKRDNPEHMATLAQQKIDPIDLVCVNLYPFKQTIMQPAVTEAAAVEQIDIGGPSMLRSAAKNFAAVLPVVDPADYQPVLKALAAGKVDLTFRRQLAAKVFQHTASYDALIAAYLTSEEFPATLPLAFEKKQELRYGENSHQKAAFYQTAIPEPFSIAQAQQLHGKALSYNNIKDCDAALRISREFSQPAVVAVKHMNPCGVGLADEIETAWDRAFAADSTSIFGGIIVLNREVDAATATKMHQLFLEIIIAPSFAPDAFAILAKKKNLRLLTLDLNAPEQTELETVSVLGGVLRQEADQVHETAADFEVVTKKQPTAAQLKALEFGQIIAKHVKSNAIVVATAQQTLGIGAGQMNRIGSAEIAIQAAESKPEYATAILASDAFFPMDDSVAYAAKHGITAIVQPGGSIKDKDSIAMADKLGVAMVFSGRRHFRH